jgi:hypothetical protein
MARLPKRLRLGTCVNSVPFLRLMMKTANRIGFAVLCCLIVSTNCFGQAKVVNSQANAKVRERINTIIKETLERGEFTTQEGVKAITRTSPLPEDVEEITGYGDRAIRPLEEHFSSANPFEYELAMRLMGALGGQRIILPLEKVILHDRSARKREYALRWITQGPWDLASKVITAAADNDPDTNVRKVAQELLSGHGP